MTVEDVVTVSRTSLPAGRWSTLVGAVQGALVFQRNGRLEVWDPFKKIVVSRLPGPFPAATHGDVIAWCHDGCEELHITDVITEEGSVVSPGRGFSFVETYYGAFSPDGSLLTVPAVADATRQNQLALVDVEQGTARLIEGSKLDETYGSITWSSSGDWLFFNPGNGRVTTYRIGSKNSVFLPVKVETPFFGMAAD